MPSRPADIGACGEIRAGDDLQDFLERGVGLFDQKNGGIDDLPQVVRRNVRGHADRDTAGAVDEKFGIREGRTTGSSLV